MENRKLLQKETDNLLEAIEILDEVKQAILGLEHSGRMGYEVSMSEVWNLRNRAQEVSAVLYNIHHGIYGR